MAEVRLNIANREYIVTCRDGEEQRLLQLGEMVDQKAQEAGGNAAGLNESRLLLFAALLLADEASSATEKTSKSETSKQESYTDNNDIEIDKAATTIEKLADRVESFAQSLEQYQN